MTFRSDVQRILRLAALSAGDTASPFYRAGELTTARISYKDKGSPVTEADIAANEAIRAVLSSAMPEAAIFSEESEDDGARFDKRRVFVVDPIDGTRAFINGGTEWCVSIAMMENGVPVAGVVYAPARAEMFEAATGGGSWLNGRRLVGLTCRTDPQPRTAGPKSMLEAVMAADGALTASEPLRALAYRLAAVAGGGIDAALASEGAHDWDIAAADVILSEAGCTLVTANGARPVYNAGKPVHPALVAAHGDLVQRLLPHLAGMKV